MLKAEFFFADMFCMCSNRAVFVHRLVRVLAAFFVVITL